MFSMNVFYYTKTRIIIFQKVRTNKKRMNKQIMMRFILDKIFQIQYLFHRRFSFRPRRRFFSLHGNPWLSLCQ